MPESQQPPGGVEAILGEIRGPASVLDVGAGTGKWGRVLRGRGFRGHLTALEVWQPHVEALVASSYYDAVISGDLVDYHDWGRHEVVILGDVLEHLPRLSALGVVADLRAAPCRAFLTIPISRCVQVGEPGGNPFETHLDQWDHLDLFDLGWRLMHVGVNEAGTVIVGTYRLLRESEDA
jgi:hypothetical protein